MDWHESEQSDDGSNHDSQTASRKRSSRACDQCRKTKSKCERDGPEGAPCKSCALAGTTCTFLGPSYKRGPPKGYIHAIEQRWHQVESLLGSIMQCPDPRVQSVVADLRQDDLAREILGRVDMGPYGPSGRISQPNSATKEDFFASVLRSNGSPSPPFSSTRETSRSRRQSRVSREKVSSVQDRGLSVVPTREWQDALSKRLAFSSSSALPNYDPSSSTVTFDSSNGHAAQKRRLNGTHTTEDMPPDWNSMYTLDPEGDERDSVQDPMEKLGELSLDENHEVRWHGRASALHLLSINERTDNRKEGGIWALPMARVWPPSKDHVISSDDHQDVSLPSMDIQDKLIQLYFSYIHPTFPVIHKSRFLVEYHTGKSDPSTPPQTYGPSPKPEPQQRLSPLLLLSMFSLAARFSDKEMPLPAKGKMWEAGSEYLKQARDLLAKSFHQSRPSTVQSLLLLGYREFGIGSMEQGWIYIGMGIRMAVDLGLNCNADGWKVHGRDLFSDDEKQTRRQIWWACCMADRYGSVYMGRPVIIRDGDFDVPLPETHPGDEQLWQPLSDDTIDINYSPMPGRVMCCFAATSRLSVIVGAIISKIYPVRSCQGISRRSLLSGLESELDQWYLGLPDELRYDTANKHNIPPPHILFLHIRYWGAVLLLNRAFIPNWKGPDSTPRHSTMEMKAFDLSQSAASHISTIVNAYRERFTMKRSSPFLTAYVFHAGIMHILTLTLRPSNVQASVGLKQAMAALKDMEVVWPSASRAWELLNGVNFGVKNAQQVSLDPPSGRPKRDAEDAFGPEKSSNYLEREAFGLSREQQRPISQGTDSGVQDLSTRIMAHFLGLDVPGVEPSTSYYPGYEWWPRTNPNQHPQSHSQTASQSISPALQSPTDMTSLGAVPPGGPGIPFGRSGTEGWMSGTGQVPYSFHYNYDL